MADSLGERCCLKNSVPAEDGVAPHWTGLPPRAFVPGSGNKTLSKQCAIPQPPPPAPPAPPAPYPGPTYLAPKIHNSPACLHHNGWHDIAGALTFKGTHHVFQGCPEANGWHHAASSDLVHWEDLGLGPMALHETHAGMDSDDSPCSGFVTVDDAGVVCAGFRQCGSSKGVAGGQAWDVPLELRCAENDNLTLWSDPIWLYDVFFYRALPYDPIRPWKDSDGMWCGPNPVFDRLYLNIRYAPRAGACSCVHVNKGTIQISTPCVLSRCFSSSLFACPALGLMFDTNNPPFSLSPSLSELGYSAF